MKTLLACQYLVILINDIIVNIDDNIKGFVIKTISKTIRFTY